MRFEVDSGPNTFEGILISSSADAAPPGLNLGPRLGSDISTGLGEPMVWGSPGQATVSCFSISSAVGKAMDGASVPASPHSPQCSPVPIIPESYLLAPNPPLPVPASGVGPASLSAASYLVLVSMLIIVSSSRQMLSDFHVCALAAIFG